MHFSFPLSSSLAWIGPLGLPELIIIGFMLAIPVGIILLVVALKKK